MTVFWRRSRDLNNNIRVVKVSDENPARSRPRLKQARIIFDPPKEESVFVIYWRGSKQGLFDAKVEYIAPDNCLINRYPVRHDYINGLLTPISTDTPLPNEWFDENSEQLEIITYRGAKRLDNLQYTLRW
jgi:hypothetical protein